MPETEITYNSFTLDQFKDFKAKMENYRRNCFGEDMEAVWETIQKQYLPKNEADLRVMAKYTLNTDGTATPDRLFVQEDTEIIDTEEPLVAIKVHTGLSLLTQRTPD